MDKLMGMIGNDHQNKKILAAATMQVLRQIRFFLAIFD